MRELPKRILAAIFIVGPLFILPMWIGGVFALLLSAAISFGLVWEFRGFSHFKLSKLRYAILVVSCWIWQTCVFIDCAYVLQIYVGLSLILLVLELEEKETDGTAQRSAISIFLFFYCGILPSFLFLIREFGRFWAIFPAVVVWVVDTGAYWGGTLTGKHALAKLVSPKKTIEGFFWGIFAGFICSAFAQFIFPEKNRSIIWLIAATAGIIGQMGDLFESKIKRQFSVKDTGSIFPGHGGIWDRTDSLLWVYPIIWVLLSSWH